MPELSPLKGWTEWRALTNLSETEPRGNTPAKGFVIYYLIDQDVPEGLQQWGMDFDILRSDGVTPIFTAKLTLPVLVTPGVPGLWPAIWSIQNARLDRTRASSHWSTR